MVVRLLFLLSLLGSARADDAAESLIKATYKVYHKESVGTCLVVEHEGAPYLVSAHHLLKNIPGKECLLVSRERKDNGAYRRKDLTLQIRDREGEDRWRKHPKHDLAVLRLPDDLKVQALASTALATMDDAGELHSGDRLIAAVFPERQEANGAGFPILRSGLIASYPIAPIKPHPTFLLDMTAFGGDSGGPVMHATARRKNGGPVVVGIVLGKRHWTETVEVSANEERRIKHPIGVAIAIHGAFVLEMLEEEGNE